MILIGELSLWVALVMAAWSAIVSYAGGAARQDDLIESGARALYATFAMVLLASLGLWTALLSKDFSFEYVARHVSTTMPSVYVFTAFWSGQAGSMLLWALILSMYGTIAVATSRVKNRESVPWATGTISAILLFIIASACLDTNPFTRLAFTPIDGRGMDPRFQNPGMAVHPPSLYLGYAATAIPFAFAIAALLARTLDREWLIVVRRWSLISWFFLTVGIILGMWWAYAEVGWGGYWAWDPVQNVSLLPWLTNTAFLHSILIQEKRGMLRRWNVVLVVMTFLLAMLGTFIARSGRVDSLHSFARSPVGPWIATFFFLTGGLTVYLVGSRLTDLGGSAKLERVMGREAALLSNNVVLCGIALAVLVGTVFPILAAWAGRPKAVVGAGYFTAVAVPLGLLLLALMGAGPLMAWRGAFASNVNPQFAGPVAVGILTAVSLLAAGMRSPWALVALSLGGFVCGSIVQEFYKGTRARQSLYGEAGATALWRLASHNRRRYGGYVVHAGIVMVFAAFAGMTFDAEHDFTLHSGEAYDVMDPYGRRWRFVSQGVSTFGRPDRNVMAVALDASVDGKHVGILSSEQRQYFDAQRNALFTPITEAGVRSTAKMDTYVVLSSVRGTDTAAFKLMFNPLVAWLWAGSAVMLVGGLIVMWPRARAATAVKGTGGI